MKRGKKKGSSGIGWLLLIVLLAAAGGWSWWNYKLASPPGSTIGTNGLAIDLSKATNIIRWLETNVINRPTNVVIAPATNPVVAPPTNLVVVPPPPVRFTNAVPPKTNELREPFVPEEGRPVRDVLEAQIALTRMAISSGPVDGLSGFQTREAIKVFQELYDLRITGELDAATRDSLRIIDPVFAAYVITAEDLARITRIPDSWLEKSRLERLDYESILELVAEKNQAHTNLIRTLNPNINWTSVRANTSVKVPYTTRFQPRGKAAFIRIALAAKTLQAFDGDTNLLAHFPCSIAQKVEKRPVGELHVVTGAPNPNYTFNPEVFPESPEAQRIGRKLTIPPGPNNPVGTAWISLDKPGYGIHGTPLPEKVGRTESHGCFRLANWNAEYLLRLAWPGLPVYVEP